MFRNKSDVDKRVSALLYNAKNEHERNLRCYNIALLYYKAHDFESAQRYATMYLTVRDDSAAAHKLLGQAYEKLGQKDKAIASYSKSLKLESDQSDLILKICELLIDKDVEFDPQLARYWSDRASLMFPHSTPVFMLKEKLMMSDSSLASEDLEELLHAELKTKPTDMNTRIKLLKLYAESGRVELALNHAFEVESRQSHSSLMWFRCINDICKIYNRDNPAKCNWEFYLQWISVLDRMCSFCVSETSNIFDLSEVTECVYNLDQTVHQAKQSLKGPELFKEFVKYISSQLAFYLGILLLKKAKKETFWKETKKLVSPLLFLALLPPPVCDGSWTVSIKENYKKLINTWVHHSNCRIAQAGYVLLSLSKENHSEKMFIDKVSHFICSDWRSQIFEKCFPDIKQINPSNSHFMTGVEFSKVLLKMPSSNSFKSSLYVSSFENIYFGSLHHLVWLGLQQLKKTSISEIKLPSFRTTCFKSLLFTISNLNNIGVETINQLDIDSFLYATVFCAAAVIENHKTNGYLTEERMQVLPAVISPQMCTAEQSKWWLHVCSLVRGSLFTEINSSENISDLRFSLQRGLEVIRGEGLPPLLIVAIARTFASRALISEVHEEAEGCQARALHLWKLVYPILESYAMNRSLVSPARTNSFFDFPVDLNSQDAKKLLEEAKFFIGCHYMNTNQFEKAIEEFKTLKSPQAIFNLAMVYHKWAELQVEGLRGEEITSEIRCRHVVLASKAREYLVKVKTLIRNDCKHPLYSSIESKLLDIDEMLARIEPENSTSERDANGTLDGSLSGGSGGTPAFADLNMVMSSSHRNRLHHTSTPRRMQEQKTNNFNMSELIDLLSVQHTTNQLKMQQVLEQVRLIVDKVENSTSEQRNLIDGLTSRLNNFEAEIKNSIAEVRKDIKRPDLCNMFEEDDYTDEMLQYQNYSQYYQHPQRTVQNSAAAIPYGNQYFSPRLDPLYQGNISFYNQGALQFSEGQQLPDFLRAIPPGSQKLPQPLLHQSGVQAPFSHIAGVPGTSKTPVHTNVIPTNLVLPTEPLPSSSHQPHPPLSVSIPPIGNKSSTIPGVPHNFQIPLPPQPKPVLNIEERVEEETPPPAYDPLPDFKPLVPLPKEIEVSTGEEGEEILFEKKAKLFRFIDSEWKERGVGILKILKHKDTGKYRIVMRREQVHKICANHFLTPDLNLEPKTNADKAWVWVANDFADEEMRLEKFCAKFKTPEDSAEFKKVFDDAKKELQNIKGLSSVETNPEIETSKTIVPTSTPHSASFISSTETNYALTNTLFKLPSATQNVNTSSSNKPFTLSGIGESSVQAAASLSKTNLGGFSFSLSQPKLKLPEEPKEVRVETSKESNPFSKLSFGTTTTMQDNANNFGSIFGGKTSVAFGVPAAEFKSKSVLELKKTFGDVKTDTKENIFSLNFQKTEDEKNKKADINLQGEGTKNIDSKTNLPLSSVIKAVPGSWECKSCYVRNKSDQHQCEACGDKKPGSSLDAKSENNKLMGSNEMNKASSVSGLNIEKPSLSSLLKPAPGSWECKSCYVRNTSDLQTCSACNNKKPGVSLDSKPEINKVAPPKEDIKTSLGEKNSVTNLKSEQPSLSSLLKPSPGSWECTSCYVRNKSDIHSCEACGTKRPGSTVDTSVKKDATPGFVFGGSSQPTTDSLKFTFGSNNTFSFPTSSTFSFNASTVKSTKETTSTISSQKPEFGFTFPPSSETGSQFSFGKPVFQFTMPEVKQTSPLANKSLDESHDSEPEEEEDHLQFQPVIPLPDKINVVTGEENETVLYCMRAKLFRYDSSSKEWKERGVGDVKILKHNISGKIRFLMRRDQVMKICLNHFITDEIILRPKAKDDKTWLWYAVDYSEGVETKENFAIRFKSAEIAQEFKQAFDDALANVKTLSLSTTVEGTPIRKQEETSSNQEVVQDASVSNSDSDIEITYEQKAPPELVEKALALKLPANFYCYLEKPPCPGCCGCEADNEDEKDSNEVNKSLSKDFDLKRTEVNDSQQLNKEIRQVVVEDKKPISFGFNPNTSVEGFSFASALKTNEPETKTVDNNSSRYFFKNDSSFSNPAPVNSIFGSGKSSTFGGDAFSFKSIAESSSIPVNDAMPFTSFAQSANAYNFGGQNENFKWEGAGSQLFADTKNKGPGTAAKDDDDEGDSDNGEGDDDHDPQFAPIIPLPEKIELKTGEEDEDVVFSERAMLYRFDNKEWKQRGTGEMKLLKHKTKNTYRLIMRREQVYKLVCNHLIPADFELKTKSDKAFCWSALNYCPDKSDDKPVSESLCIKFKDENLARKFKTAIEDCLKSLRENGSST
ncbi:E3 SUMO-protein ligase RanBP2 isoform X2 [Halyomorpha halys]|uniref:E3 SUMO-protein ligase RanBP2 isoform X2 n=1 Tax=Halyomorpha halys TaxID=286706 RepID=UPI000D0C7683|nr:E3 SUMO-protein ligase RanBP2 isoform X2 [Halyomorpha halys]